jgi:hypothetical protein
MSDQVFAAIGLGREAVAVIRQRFTSWPSTARASDRVLEAVGLGTVPSGYLQSRADRYEAQEDSSTSLRTDTSRDDPEAGR